MFIYCCNQKFDVFNPLWPRLLHCFSVNLFTTFQGPYKSHSKLSWLWSLLNNSGLDGRGLSVCWNPDCRCRRCLLLPKFRRLPFSGFLPLDILSPAVGDLLRSGRCRCVEARRELWACPGKYHCVDVNFLPHVGSFGSSLVIISMSCQWIEGKVKLKNLYISLL